MHKNNRIKIFKAIEVDQIGKSESIDNNLTIALEQKAIKVLSLQKQGKKIISAKRIFNRLSN